MDYGRSSSACGVELGGVYAETVELIYDHELYDVPGWLSAPALLNPVLSSEEQCQHLCAAHPNCDYFSYEYELLEPVRHSSARTTGLALIAPLIARWDHADHYP